jgi:hypothetical protein
MLRKPFDLGPIIAVCFARYLLMTGEQFEITARWFGPISAPLCIAGAAV